MIGRFFILDYEYKEKERKLFLSLFLSSNPRRNAVAVWIQLSISSIDVAYNAFSAFFLYIYFSHAWQ